MNHDRSYDSMVSHPRRYLWLPAFLRVRFLGRSFSSLTLPQSYSWSESMVSTFMHTRTTCRSTITQLHRAWPACCNEWPFVSRMSPPGCPRIDYASIPRRLNSSGWDNLDGFRTVPRTPKWEFWDLSFVRSTRSEISVCSSTAALPCLIMSTKSPRCVSSIFDNFASCDEHWRMRLHTPWYELSSTTGLTTATVFWLPVRNTSLRSYSPCFVSQPDSSYDCPVARLFPLWCVINYTGCPSNQEWSSSWLSWLTSRFTVWLRSTCLLTVFQCRVCQVAHIFDRLVSGPCSSPELRLWQSALGVFTVRALASGTPCLRLFVTSICHWRLSDRNWNFICLLLNLCKSMYI